MIEEMAQTPAQAGQPAQQPTRMRVSLANGFIRRPTIQGRQVTILVFPDFFQSAELTIWPVRPEQKAKNPSGPDVYGVVSPKFVGTTQPGTGSTAGQVMGVGGTTAPAPTGETPAPATGTNDDIPF